MDLHEQLINEAKLLLRRALQASDEHYGFGTMSCAAYDTAWVSLVTKTVDGQKRWLFPECFQFLLDTQSTTGGWETGMGAPIDGILNTAGPLLALKRHSRMSMTTIPQHNYEDLAGRIDKATASLQCQLVALDVSTTEHVGFEIIVPAMLDLLKAEDPSLVFNFPARNNLMKIHDAKLSRFRPEYLYGSQPITALHSLEAFIGKIDFDKVQHHKINGSIMGSPSSTAAYLMNASQWDDESEAYLRHVVQHAAGQGTGAVPSAFPSTHFELSWMLTTLTQAGFSASQLACDELDQIINMLAASFEKEGGTIGYAPGFLADVDDTAKAITALTTLGRAPKPWQMLKVFETATHFQTYTGERDPSFTANCNVLSALLAQPDAINYGSQIQKVTKFLCDYWWRSDGKIKDKWNTCYLYPSVLLVEALVGLVSLVEGGKLAGVLGQDLQHRVAITLFQACLRPLLDQAADGSWGRSIEATAYAVLILCEARNISFFDRLAEPVNQAIRRGIAFADSMGGDDARPNYIWIEKVSYASPVLTKSYLLAARWAARSASSSGGSVGRSLWTPPLDMDNHVQLFHQAELFASLPKWELYASMVEAALFTPMLRAHRLDVFPRSGVEEDKYLDVIPLFLTAANNRTRTYASTLFLYDMCFIAMLNFQLDEFIEATASILYRDHMDDLRQIIHDLLDDKICVDKDQTPAGMEADLGINGQEDMCRSDVSSDMPGNKSPEYKAVFSTLAAFLEHVLQHPSIQSAGAWDRRLLARELRTYLLAHVQQAVDSIPGMATRVSTSTRTFFDWVRTTAADHISCPYAFRFVACHLSATLTPRIAGGGCGGDCFSSVGEKYLAAAVCRHLATMCRMHNDFGSAERDRDEGNLNSLDFPEFKDGPAVEVQQDALLRLAEFERDSYLDALRRLKNEVNHIHVTLGGGDAETVRLAQRRMAIYEFFTQQVDSYGQIYVIRDISARIPKNDLTKKIV